MLRRVRWWIAERVDYVRTATVLWLLDRVAGPLPATEQDMERDAVREARRVGSPVGRAGEVTVGDRSGEPLSKFRSVDFPLCHMHPTQAVL